MTTTTARTTRVTVTAYPSRTPTPSSGPRSIMRTVRGPPTTSTSAPTADAAASGT